MKIKLLISTLWLLLFSACHCEKKTTETKASNDVKTQSSTTDEVAALNNLVVSFYSTGGGANYKAARELEDFLFEYTERTKTPIPYSKIAWGKEGEVDYCISLTGWVDDSKGKFIAGVKDLLKGVQVHISENQKCREMR